MFYSFDEYQWWLWLIIFYFAIIISFYLPGFLLLQHSNLKIRPSVLSFVLACVIGFALWGFQGYVFGYIGIRWMTYVYILGVLVGAFLLKQKVIEHFSILIKTIFSTHKITLGFILLGMVLQIIPVFGSGIRFQDGIRFFGVNAYDGVMHLSYIQSIISTFPPQEPGATGYLIKNYHYWSDLVIAELSRIWKLPISNTFFQFMPPFISILTGISMYQLIRLWKWPSMSAWLALFFLYFGGDGAYSFMLLLHKTFGFFTPAIDNGATQFLNMPTATAKMIFITGLIALHFWTNSHKRIWGIIIVILFSSLFGFKVYFGLYALIGFSLLLGVKVYKNILTEKENTIGKKILYAGKKEHFSFLLFLFFLIVTATIYLPPNSASGGFIYAPLEWPKLFLGTGSLDFTLWWNMRRFFETTHNPVGIVLVNSIAIIIMFVCVYGTRILGFFLNKHVLRVIGWEKIIFFIPGLFLFNILGLFTLQISGGLNVFNFFVVSAVILSIFSSLNIAMLLQSKKKYALALLCAITILTVPRVIYETYHALSLYVTIDSATLVSNDELAAFSYIKTDTKKNAIIQSHPKNHLDSRTPYIAFFTGHKTYLTGIGLLETHNQLFEERNKDLEILFTAPNSADFAQKLKQRGIEYVYLQKTSEQTFPYELTTGHFNYVYENKSILLLQPKP